MVKLLRPVLSAVVLFIAFISSVIVFNLGLLSSAVPILRPRVIHRIEFLLGEAHLAVTRLN